MPRMNGFQLLKRIKSMNELSEIPVVILTASHDEHHRKKGLSHLADGYLTKPYTEAARQAQESYNINPVEFETMVGGARSSGKMFFGLVFTSDGDGFVTENFDGVLHRFVGTASSTV